MSILKLLASTSFITVNKLIAKELGMTEAIILGVLCSGYSYYESKGLLNGDFFPFSTEMLQEETTFGETAQRNAINHLISIPVDKDSIKASIEATTIDPTLFLVWFVENFPTSLQQTREQQASATFWEQFK